MNTNGAKYLSFSSGTIERKTKRKRPRLARRRLQWRSKNKRDHRSEMWSSASPLRRGIASIYACTHVRETYVSVRSFAPINITPYRMCALSVATVGQPVYRRRSTTPPEAISLSLSISHPFAGQETPEHRLLCRCQHVRKTQQKVQREKKTKKGKRNGSSRKLARDWVERRVEYLEMDEI